MPKYEKINDRKFIVAAINEFDLLREKDFLSIYKFGKSKEYDLWFNGKPYPPKAIIGVAYGKEFPDEGVLTKNECKNSKLLRKKYSELGFEILKKSINLSTSIAQEIEFRNNLWKELLKNGGAKNIKPSLINDLKIYYGGRGIWVNKERTGKILETGITVGVLHTGKHYADDLTEDGVLYHYPKTESEGHDFGGIMATKKAGVFGIPIFIVTHSKANKAKRDVFRGWVLDWDDTSNIFRISFDEEPPTNLPAIENPKNPLSNNDPFSPVEKKTDSFSNSKNRKGQNKFRLDVIKRYEPYCAICGIGFTEILIAAHLHPVEKNGTNDERNGLLLCSNHHAAFDKGLFAIDPNTYNLVYKPKISTKTDLRIIYDNLNHLPELPHKDALKYSWKIFNKSYKN